MKRHSTYLPRAKRSSLLRYFNAKILRLQRAIQFQQELIKLPGATRGELLDEAAEAAERARDIAVLGQLIRELDQVRTARERLEQGQYGICQDCGKIIPAARLQALPYATLCVRCQTLRGPDDDAPRPNHAHQALRAS
jgi:RNA polymerase-binding transcription factor DksA